MSRRLSLFLAVALAVFAVVFKPFLLPFLLDLQRSPKDEQVGTLSVLSEEELKKAYAGKRVLVVGGTRGVGLGTALAAAGAGAADVTIVGRSEKSGAQALQRLRQAAAELPQPGTFSFIQGDIGSVNKANDLVKRLEEYAATTLGNDEDDSSSNRFDYLVVTAAIFPRWDGSQQQEDGVDACFFVAVVGRYIIYKNIARFMSIGDDDPSKTNNSQVRVLNVLASGELPAYQIKRELARGDRNASSLFESIINFGAGNELMLKILDADPSLHLGTTRVSTHPGAIATELHHGQALWFDVVEYLSVKMIGISVEESGLRQASILASPGLRPGKLTYVSSDMVGRLTHPKLTALLDADGQWLKDFLDGLVK